MPQNLKTAPWPLLEKAREFRAMVAEAKRRIGNRVEWYPYDTLSAIAHFDRLLGASHRHLLEPKEGARRVLDLGCGDGEMSLFLEWLGFEVVAADHPRYNHNGMRGVRALREALGSRMEIREVDLDALAFPEGSYDLMVLLGVLYHLRNPFHALEQMARHGTRCLLSTRVAARLPGGKALPKETAWAYLLDENEIAGDDSNYFVFSDAALRLLLKRTHWRVLDYRNTGATGNSEPVRLIATSACSAWSKANTTGWRTWNWARDGIRGRKPAGAGPGGIFRPRCRRRFRWAPRAGDGSLRLRRAAAPAGRVSARYRGGWHAPRSRRLYSCRRATFERELPAVGTGGCVWIAPPTHGLRRMHPIRASAALWCRA